MGLIRKLALSGLVALALASPLAVASHNKELEETLQETKHENSTPFRKMRLELTQVLKDNKYGKVIGSYEGKSGGVILAVRQRHVAGVRDVRSCDVKDRIGDDPESVLYIDSLEQELATTQDLTRKEYLSKKIPQLRATMDCLKERVQREDKSLGPCQKEIYFVVKDVADRLKEPIFVGLEGTDGSREDWDGAYKFIPRPETVKEQDLLFHLVSADQFIYRYVPNTKVVGIDDKESIYKIIWNEVGASEYNPAFVELQKKRNKVMTDKMISGLTDSKANYGIMIVGAMHFDQRWKNQGPLIPELLREKSQSYIEFEPSNLNL